MESIDQDLLLKLIESALILATGLGLFFGLRGRILRFAQWAGLPRLTFAPVRVLLRYSILVVAAALILGLWGFPVGTLLAFFGTILGLVAIGFVAVWSVLSNFLCTFVLIAFKPFSVGDEIELPGDNIRGRVTDLTLIFTTLQVGPGETVMVPNNMFFQRLFKRRAGTTTVDLHYQLRQDKPMAGPDTAPAQPV